MKKIIAILFIVVLGLAIWIEIMPTSPSENVSSGSPFGRVEWRSAMRGHDASPEKMLQAKKQLISNYKKLGNTKDAGLNKWVQLDTHKKGGRVRTIAVHPTDPNILYTGGVSGGIWKSTDKGASWNPLDNFMPSLSVTSIIIHPTKPDTMYAATGEGITGGETFNRSSPGAGIFRSVDGGDHWILVGALDENNLEGFYWVNKIAFDPADPSIFYATKDGSFQSTSNGSAQFWKFENDGGTKTLIDYGDSANSLTNIYFNPSDPDVIFLCSNGGIYISKDKGATWDAATGNPGWPASSGRVEIAMSASNNNTVYALCEGVANGILAKSTNLGDTWSSATFQIFDSGVGNQGSYDNVIWVDPLNVNNLIVGGINLWKSTNGGSTLTQISASTFNDTGMSPHADQHVIVQASDYSSSNKRLYFGNDGGIATTSNWTTVAQSTGWELLNNGLYITQFYASDIDGTNPKRIIAGAQDNGVLFSGNDGNTWEKLWAGDGGYCGFSQQDDDLIYFSFENGRFHVKCNVAPWNGNYAPYFFLESEEANPPFITTMKVYPQDGKKILIGGEGVYMIEFNDTNCIGTVNEVTPFTAPSNHYVTAMDFNKTGTISIIGYSDGSVWRTTNLPGAAMFWTRIYQNSVSFPITSIAISPIDNNKVAIATGGYVDDNVFVSVNTHEGDLSTVVWNSRSNGIPALQVNSLAWHPEKSNWIYAGTDLGIMASENNGSDWNISPNFMGVSDGPVFTEISKLQFAQQGTFGGNILVATTYGRGMWKTTTNVKYEVYLDENSTTPIQNGSVGSPYKVIDDAESVQAHGQTWYIDGGTYPVDTANKITITKRIGNVNLTGTGPVIIGNN